MSRPPLTASAARAAWVGRRRAFRGILTERTALTLSPTLRARLSRDRIAAGRIHRGEA